METNSPGGHGGGGSGSGVASNVTQFGGEDISLGPNTSANALPVTIASDQSIPITGTVTASGTLTLGAGSALIGTVQPVPGTSGGLSVSSSIIPNNTTAIVVKGSAGQLYAVEAYTNAAVIAYIKIYNATSATAGSGTPVIRKMIPAPTAGGGGGTIWQAESGVAMSTGITFVITGLIADNDTTAPAANNFLVNVYYK